MDANFFIQSDGLEIRTIFRTDSHAQTSASTKEIAMLSADVTDSVAFDIGYSVPEVQAIFAQFSPEDRVMRVWSVVPEFDNRVYRSIYAKEKQIINQFAGVEFDFNVIPSNGKDPRTIVCDSGVVLAYVRN